MKNIKTKIRIYENSIATNFHNKKIPREKAPCKSLSIIIINLVIKVNKKNITDKHIIRPLCIRLPQMTGYAKTFNENITTSFRVNDK